MKNRNGTTITPRTARKKPAYSTLQRRVRELERESEARLSSIVTGLVNFKALIRAKESIESDLAQARADLRYQTEQAEYQWRRTLDLCDKLEDAQEEHAQLLARCFEGFPSASSGVFDALVEAERTIDIQHRLMVAAEKRGAEKATADLRSEKAHLHELLAQYLERDAAAGLATATAIPRRVSPPREHQAGQDEDGPTNFRLIPAPVNLFDLVPPWEGFLDQ